jgi:hypothetical protein
LDGFDLRAKFSRNLRIERIVEVYGTVSAAPRKGPKHAPKALRIAYFIHEKKSAMESVDLRKCVREFIKIFE